MSAKAINLVTLIFFSIFLSCTSCNRDFSALEEQNECVIPTDSTSHNFTWTVDTLGEYGSVLRDVAIISETEVWAGGLIKRENKRPHTLMKWDGAEWTSSIPPLTSIYEDTSRAPINAIFALNENNVYLINDNGEFGYWNGEKWESEYVSNKDGNIHSIWGDSKENIYLAGLNGSITHYDGNSFTKQATPTTVDLNHITGFTDSRTGKTKLWASGMTTLLYSEDGQNWQIVWDENNPLLPDNYLNPTALQVVNNCLLVAVYYYTNTRLYLMDLYNLNDYMLLTQFKSYIYGLNAFKINDIFLAGTSGNIFHYNGNSIKFYSHFSGSGKLKAVDMLENHVYIVGYVGSPLSRAIIYHGFR